MNEPLLSVEHLSVRSHSGRNHILDDISFELYRGTVTGIVGESGSGKSVTALSIMQLLPPALFPVNGQIFFHGSGKPSEILAMKSSDMNLLRGRRIAMIFQEPMTSLNPSMRCGRQIDEALRVHTPLDEAGRKERILDLFNRVKLPRIHEMYSAYPHQLSGGQRQRIMIAMALAAGPDILIADEPTTALDVTVQKKIVELIRELQEDTGITVLFISHDLRLIGEIASGIIVMRNGRIVEKNTREILLKNPSNAYTRGLLACQPPLDHRPSRLLTVQDFEQGIRVIAEEEQPAATAGRTGNPPVGPPSQRALPPFPQPVWFIARNHHCRR